MTKKPNLGQINSPVFSVGQLNEAFTKIDNAFENTLSLDGSTPNAMNADLDMNTNDVINVGTLSGTSIDVEEAIIGGKLFTGTITWRSDWTTSTSYQNLDVVRYDGDLYICLEEHTSGVFATDLSSSKWELFVEAISGGGSHTHAATDITSGTLPIARLSFTKAELDTAVSDGNVLFEDDVGVSVQAYDTDTAKTDVAQNFTAAQGSTPVALSDGANIATNAALSNVFTVTLGGNRTLDNPTNLVAGRTYCWVITQDGTGSRTLTYGSSFDFPGGTAPTLSTGAGDVDLITGLAISTSRLLCVANLDFS